MKIAFEHIDGIGGINHYLNKFHEYEYAKANQIETFERFNEELTEMIGKEILPSFIFISHAKVNQHLTYEYACYLESTGINITAFSTENPYGFYALDLFKNKNGMEDIVFRFSKSFNQEFNLLTKKPDQIDKNRLSENGFKNCYSTSQILSFCTKNEEGIYEWSSPILLPDGLHCTTPLTSTDQYAQSCFEGIVAMSGKQDEMIILRPIDNANRIRESCISIGIPPILPEVFLQSLEFIIKGNKAFMPKSDEDYKIYIRPYLKGLTCGSGIGTATSYIFCIQLFPFNNFVNTKNAGLNLISLEGKRRSHDGGIGSLKVSGNYAQTLMDREKARKGLFGKVYEDVFYMGELKTTIRIEEEEQIIVTDVIDEDAAGNLIFFKQHTSGETTFYTPPLNRNAFLGGFTRDTVLKIAAAKNYNVIEKELFFNELTLFDGAILTGSAVGMSKIQSMTYKNQRIEFYTNPESEAIFETLFKALTNLRRGKIESSELTKMNDLIHAYSIVN